MALVFIIIALNLTAAWMTFHDGTFAKHHNETWEWALRILSLFASRLDFCVYTFFRSVGVESSWLRMVEGLVTAVSEFLAERHFGLCLDVGVDEHLCFTRKARGG